MGDGVQKKHALIVNGDTEPRHLENVERAIRALRSEGEYQISVASPQKPSAPADHFVPPKKAQLKSPVDGIQTQSDDDDLLVVYVTGHGDKGKQEEGCMALADGCYSLKDFQEQLLPFPNWSNV